MDRVLKSLLESTKKGLQRRPAPQSLFVLLGRGLAKCLGHYDTAVEAAQQRARALAKSAAKPAMAEEAPPPAAAVASAEHPLDSLQPGTRIRVYWKGNKKWFSGTVDEYDEDEDAWLVKYDDGEEQHEPLNDPDLLWELLSEKSPKPAAAAAAAAASSAAAIEEAPPAAATASVVVHFILRLAAVAPEERPEEAGAGVGSKGTKYRALAKPPRLVGIRAEGSVGHKNPEKQKSCRPELFLVKNKEKETWRNLGHPSVSRVSPSSSPSTKTRWRVQLPLSAVAETDPPSRTAPVTGSRGPLSGVPAVRAFARWGSRSDFRVL